MCFTAVHIDFLQVINQIHIYYHNSTKNTQDSKIPAQENSTVFLQ